MTATEPRYDVLATLPDGQTRWLPGCEAPSPEAAARLTGRRLAVAMALEAELIGQRLEPEALAPEIALAVFAADAAPWDLPLLASA